MNINKSYKKNFHSSNKNSERIAKRIARSGVCSRRDAERLIQEGRIKVDRKLIESPATLVTSDSRIFLDDKLIARPSPTAMWRYHKNIGEIVSRNDPQHRKTIFETLPSNIGYTIAVGRLDINSEGLVLLTNDGALARTLELPSTGWTRRYRVRVHGRPNADDFKTVQSGCNIKGVEYGPIKIVMENKGANSNCWLTVSLKEGKNREVRRILEHFDLRVNRLIRTSFGPFQLGNLKKGETLRVPEKVLKEQLGSSIAS